MNIIMFFLSKYHNVFFLQNIITFNIYVYILLILCLHYISKIIYFNK